MYPSQSQGHFDDLIDHLQLGLLLCSDQEQSNALLNFLASMVHPDVHCNIDELDHIPEPLKPVCLEFFDLCLLQGLSLEEQGRVLEIVRPYIYSGAELGVLQ